MIIEDTNDTKSIVDEYMHVLSQIKLHRVRNDKIRKDLLDTLKKYTKYISTHPEGQKPTCYDSDIVHDLHATLVRLDESIMVENGYLNAESVIIEELLQSVNRVIERYFQQY
jgi:predicted nucleic acid-binding protein